MDGWVRRDRTIDRYVPSATPRTVALAYAAVSGVWILVSDRLVSLAVDDPGMVTALQTAKGWVFVAGSAILIFGLVRHGQRDLARSNARLDRALQQSSVLHRVLRHNLRNSCNVIAGNAELLSENADGAAVEEECLDVIRDQTEHLVTITTKTRQLRDLVLDDPPPESVDLASLVADSVAEARERFPHATFETDLPARHVVETDPRVGLAVDELLENAVEHNDRTEPAVTVTLRGGDGGEGATVAPDGDTGPTEADIGEQRSQRARFVDRFAASDAVTTIEVADDGPGMPDVERAVLEEGMESPMFHSEGLGLWITRTVAVEAAGEIRIRDGEPRGTVVELVLPSARVRG